MKRWVFSYFFTGKIFISSNIKLKLISTGKKIKPKFFTEMELRDIQQFNQSNVKSYHLYKNIKIKLKKKYFLWAWTWISDSLPSLWKKERIFFNTHFAVVYLVTKGARLLLEINHGLSFPIKMGWDRHKQMHFFLKIHISMEILLSPST